jgi:hypothetical protein
LIYLFAVNTLNIRAFPMPDLEKLALDPVERKAMAKKGNYQLKSLLI